MKTPEKSVEEIVQKAWAPNGADMDYEDVVQLLKTERQKREEVEAEAYKQAHKDFFSMNLIASFLDFVPPEHKDIARQSYIGAVSEQVRNKYHKTMNKKPERSVDEIVKEFAERNDCIMCYGKQEKPLKMLREILEAERQKMDELEVAIMAEAHNLAIDDGTQYPKITLHNLATLLGESYHARLDAIKEAAREEERQKCDEIVEIIESIRNDEEVRAHQSNDNFKHYAVGVLDRVLQALTHPNNPK